MSTRIQPLGVVLIALAATAFGTRALAQSTDGYHAIQVFPLVVDTASFTQRFHFRAVYPWDDTYASVTFYPARGTAQATPLSCLPLDLLNIGETRFTSLRELCPNLPAGSAFGTLVVRSGNPFAAYSRVSNPAGIGFSVEAFPANAFTSARTAVTGLRRLALKADSPAFQTNCFIGNLAELAPAGVALATEVRMELTSSGDESLGAMLVSVRPGELVRVLDVFGATGVPAGDIDDVVATFIPTVDTGAGLLTFCTVQDNTSFGADFRIGKQEVWGNGNGLGAQDGGALRDTWTREEEPIDEESHGAAFSIPAGASRNIHLFYFRHPDQVACWLFDDKDTLVTAAYGLEMRLRVHDPDGWHVLAGGNDSVAFNNLYLGDKAVRGAGFNTTYQLEVESNGRNAGAVRPYMVSCASGSGSTRGELMRKGLAPVF